MKHQPFVLGLALLLAFPSLTAQAEDALPPKAAPAPDVSLEAALRAATPPKQGLVLAVDAAKVSLPKDAVRPGDTLKAWEVGSLYGQSVQHFGDSHRDCLADYDGRVFAARRSRTLTTACRPIRP